MNIISKIKCYVINLDRSKDRLEYITQAFNERNLKFERVTAVDGTLLSKEECKQHNEKSVFPRELGPPEIGCFLSHRKCWKQIIESNFQWAAVFEDDIILSKNIGSILQNIDWIPEGVDIVKLDTAKIKCVIGHRSSVIGHYQIGRLLSDHYGTGGYIISQQCAKRLHDLMQYAIAPIDEIYFNIRYGMLRELNVQQIIPAVVMHQSEIQSTICGRTFNKKKEYNRSIASSLSREIQRTYQRHIRPHWLALTRECRTEKIDFQ